VFPLTGDVFTGDQLPELRPFVTGHFSIWYPANKHAAIRLRKSPGEGVGLPRHRPVDIYLFIYLFKTTNVHQMHKKIKYRYKRLGVSLPTGYSSPNETKYR